jgi:N-methylhydantoinase A
MLDEQSGRVKLVKMSSTPRDPSIAFMEVVDRCLSESSVDARRCAYLVHGTTVATNTIIEGKGAKTALLVTEGFRDIFEIGRQIRPRLYDLFCDKPPPLVERRLCFEVPERLDASGGVVRSLDVPAVREIVEALRRAEVEAVVVCLLHSYVNAEHERQVAALLHEAMPGLYVTLSSDICPEMREYFRASTAAINAKVMPVVCRYIERLQESARDRGLSCDISLMTSSGGIISSAVARREPVHLIESGPAAGVTAAAYYGQMAGYAQVISFDMGGTTAKLGLVEDGRPRIAPSFEVGAEAVASDRGAGYPVRTPVVDLVEIGAGGGSIAWVDAGGALRVGPRSGGADPGPACYGLGQEEPTITDANLVLGRINPDFFLGGERKLRLDLAEEAVGRLARRLALGVHETAHGIVAIANAHMMGAARTVSVQRGFDPRDFTLVAFGGAGPLHANELARELGVARLLIPRSPGVTSALGLLVGDIKHDYIHSFLTPLDAMDMAAAESMYRRFEDEARAQLAAESVEPAAMHLVRRLDVRYVGQSHELTIDLPDRLDASRAVVVESISDAFCEAHRRVYGFAEPREPAEIVNLRLVALGNIRRPSLEEVGASGPDAAVAVKPRRPVYFEQMGGRVDCPIYDRSRLCCGHVVAGPAIVEEYDSTTVIHPGSTASVDRFANLIVEMSK